MARTTVTHSVMFHHFDDENHPVGQGSLSANQFSDMLDWLKKHHTVLSADEYHDKFIHNKLNQTDICLSFDDALRCQYDVALPVLNAYNLRAFFFVYTSPMTGDPDYLEIFRYFRTVAFENIDGFYEEFFDTVHKNHAKDYDKHRTQFQSIDYLAAFPFYTDNDRWFRYLRDQMLGKDKYETIMCSLMDLKTFDIEGAKKQLWLADAEIKNLHNDGHSIGLHSHTHPTVMGNLTHDEQKTEYRQNQEILKTILGQHSKITAMSHPCGNYNEDTLDILKEMGITIGFRSNMAIPDIKSPLEIPREDHANILKEMTR